MRATDEELVYDLRRAFARLARAERRRRLKQRIITTVLVVGWMALLFAIAMGWLQ